MPLKDNEAKVMSCRVSLDDEKRVHAVAAELTKRAKGAPITTSAVMGILVLRSLDALEQELGLASKQTKKSA